MGRLLAIDYGTKRTGIAVSDSLKIIATGLTTVPTHALSEFLSDFFNKEEVEKVIIGLPRQANNEYSKNMKYIETFVRQFKKKFKTVPIEYYDERFTSVIANQTIRESGLKKKDRQNKALVDKISATIILQDYMESLLLKNNR